MYANMNCSSDQAQEGEEEQDDAVDALAEEAEMLKRTSIDKFINRIAELKHAGVLVSAEAEFVELAFEREWDKMVWNYNKFTNGGANQ
jgi:hypothetical protein